jgi:hypothetical protein
VLLALPLLLILTRCQALKPGGQIGSTADAAEAGPADGAADDSSDDADAAEAGPLLAPQAVFPGDLQLWLSADTGVKVDAQSRLVTWLDRSGSAHDATPRTAPGPSVGAHTMNGVPVPYFSAPAGGPPYVGETLDVDLTWLAGAEYTFFVVARAAAARPVGSEGILIGTQAPDEAKVASCGPDVSDDAVFLGYVRQLGLDGGLSGPALTLGQTCNSCWAPDVGQDIAPAIVTAVVGAGPGHRLYRDGRLVVTSGSIAGLVSADPRTVAGAIGRGLLQDSKDMRFDGDIAEIVGYARALDDASRSQVELYLSTKWGVPLGA